MHQFQITENATLLPMEDLRFGLTRAGLYDALGRRIDAWPLLISADSRLPIAPRRLRTTPEKATQGGFIYGGMFNPRFGHFITETVPNLVAIAIAGRAFPDYTLLFHCWPHFGSDQIGSRSFIAYFLDLLGLADRKVALVMQPLRVERMVLPEAPFDGKFAYKPWLPALLDSFLPRPPRWRMIGSISAARA